MVKNKFCALNLNSPTEKIISGGYRVMPYTQIAKI